MDCDRRLKRKLSLSWKVFGEGTTKTGRQFRCFVWRDFCDCFVNGVCYGDRQKKCRSLTSIMRITVEFRFVEHCSWLLNPQLSKIVLFFGQTSDKKATKLDESKLVACRLFELSAASLRSFCSRIQFRDSNVIHQRSSVIFPSLHDRILSFLGKQ